MKQSLYITKYLISILKTNAQLVSKLTDTASGFKVFPITAKLDTTFPFCIIHRQNVNANYCKDGRYEDIVTVSIMIASPKYDESVEIASLVRETIDMKSVNDENIKIKTIKLNSISENLIDNTFLQQLDFEIML